MWYKLTCTYVDSNSRQLLGWSCISVIPGRQRSITNQGQSRQFCKLDRVGNGEGKGGKETEKKIASKGIETKEHLK